MRGLARWWVGFWSEEKKRKGKTALAMTATASDCTAGISWKRQSKCKHKAQTPPPFSKEKKKEKTTLAVTATVSSTAGISLDESE